MAVATREAPAATGVGAPPRRRAPLVLIVGLLAAELYAAFAHGAVDVPDEARLQVLLGLLALGAALAWLTAGSLRLRASARAWWGLGGLLGFAAWSALSLVWSVAPAQTWVELNRALEYALAVALALAIGATDRRALERFTHGWLLVATAVALYALGGKVAPALHVNGLFDLDQTALLSRLRAPLDYWNALSLLVVLAVPIALIRAADAGRPPRRRLEALLALALLLTVAGLTYSRGGIVALLVVVVVLTFLGGRRLRPLAVFALAAVATAPALAYAFSAAPLTHDGVSLASRTGPGVVLALILVASLAALWFAGRRLIGYERGAVWGPARERAAWRAAGVSLAALLLAGVLAMAVSSRGVGGTISHQLDSFTAVKRDNVSDPNRLLSVNSGNRWVWWKEAAGAFSARPLHGWGAGSFPVTHLLYRKQPLPVLQPHDTLLQMLAEDGLVGTLLGFGALLALLAAALARTRRRGAAPPAAPESDRMLAIACFAAGLAWLLHGFFDWDWDIPGVTIPALALLGVAAADPYLARGYARPRRPAAATVALGAVTIALCAFVVSAVLPAWSQSKARGALAVAAATSDPARLARAAADADLAARLNPLATEPLVDAATIAAERGLDTQARRYLLEAANRAPYDATVWDRLAALALTVGDRVGGRRAALRALALDPVNVAVAGIAVDALSLATPPQDSPSATGTPLPAPAPVAPALPAPTPTPVPAPAPGAR